MKSYVVCVPSYKRANICKDKTLTTLKNFNISNKCIYVFVANKEEYDIYNKIIPKNMYYKLIIGKKGLVNQREFIQNFFPKDKNIVMMDDDIQDIDLSLSPKFKNHSLNQFFKEAFEICRKHNSYIWGVYPVYNPFFREPKQEVSTTLKFIVGTFYGIINRPNDKSLKLNISTKFKDQKEDVERTIKYFLKDGVVIRFNKVGFKTKYYGTEGGMGNFNMRLIPNKQVSYKFKHLYPNLGNIKIRKNGMTEFVLKPLSTLNSNKSKTKKHKSKTKKTLKKTSKKR